MIKAILTDIEGTTSSIDFVHQVLFPYARKHLADFVRTHQDNPDVQEQLVAVERELGEAHLSLDEALAHLMEWMDEDRKLTPLKVLQGMVWEQGYRHGDFTGHVYDDAVKFLRLWSGRGIHLYVYSSGSVQAQKLLFAHSDAGDLTALFSGYFDTTIGAKREVAAYRLIVEALELAAEEIVFLSDIPAELQAAKAAGMQAIGLARHAQPMSVEAVAFEWCHDFADVENVMQHIGA